MAFKSFSIIFPLNNIMISSSFCCSPLIKAVNSCCIILSPSYLTLILLIISFCESGPSAIKEFLNSVYFLYAISKGEVESFLSSFLSFLLL